MFILSKLLSAITQPLFWLAVWWGVALLLLTFLATWRRAALRMLWSGLAVLGLLGFEAGPHALLRPLENRYPVPTAEAVGRHVGVMVLGGATEHPDIYQAHGQVPLGGAAERMTVPVGLNWNEHSAGSATTTTLLACCAACKSGLAALVSCSNTGK